MKITVIGDIHGNPIWKQIVETEYDSDLFVFLGDYVDEFPPVTGEQIYQNLKEIVQFKADYPEQVCLLMGNHDYQYCGFTGSKYSGFNEEYADRYKAIYLDLLANNQMHVALHIDNLLLTHAGLSKTFAEKLGIDLEKEIDTQLQEKFYANPELFDFALNAGFDQTGEHKEHGIFWIRPQSLSEDNPTGLVQIVGHTKTHKVKANRFGSIILNDALRKKQYIVIEDQAIKDKAL